MSVELNWREGEESGDVLWEQAESPVAAAPARSVVSLSRPRPSRSRTAVPFLLAVLAGILIGGAGLAAFVAVRAHRGSELARRDVEASAVQLFETQRSGDVRGYALLLDPSLEVWRSRQIASLRQASPPPAEAQVRSIRLQDDVAMAELLESPADGGELTTRTHFFRQRNGQWLLTAPRPEMFGALQQAESPHFLIEYRRDDRPAIPALVDVTEGFYVALCGELRCRASERPMPLVLDYEDGAIALDGALHVSSPRLLGMDGAGHPGPAFESALAWALAARLTADGYPTTSGALRASVGEWAEADLAGASASQMSTLLQAARRGDLMTLDGLWRSVAQNNFSGPLEVTQMASMLTYAQQTFGSGAVGRMLEAFPGDLATVLQRAFGVSIDEFEAGWQQWLLAGSGASTRPA